MIGNKTVGSPQSYKVFVSGEGRKRAVIVINNKQVDTILINQQSNEDVVVLETKVDTARIIIASMYFDINQPIDIHMQKIQATLAHAKGAGIIIVMDSKSRSTMWHEVLTNKRGKTLEESLMSKQLHIINKESCCTTFRTSQGASNIDFIVINNQALHVVGDWVICVCMVCVWSVGVWCVCHHSSPSMVTVSKQYSYIFTTAFPFMACTGTALTASSLGYRNLNCTKV